MQIIPCISDIDFKYPMPRRIKASRIPVGSSSLERRDTPHDQTRRRRDIDQPGFRPSSAARGFCAGFPVPGLGSRRAGGAQGSDDSGMLRSGSKPLIASIHTWVLRTLHPHYPDRQAVPATTRTRPALPRFHQQKLPFLERLAEAGVSPTPWTMSAPAPIFTSSITAAGIRGSSMAAGCQPFQTPNTCSPRLSTNTGRARPGGEGFNAGVYQDSVLPVVKKTVRPRSWMAKRRSATG